MKETNSCDISPETVLKQCEITISKGIQHFLAVGQALSTIREKRLYRLNDHKTFEDYCQTKWNVTRQYASNLISAFQVEAELSTVVDKLALKNERQGREIRQLDDGGKAEVKKRILEPKARGEVFEVLQPFVKWCEEFEKSQKASKEQCAKDKAVMRELDTEFKESRLTRTNPNSFALGT